MDDFQKSSDQIAKLQKLHEEELASKDQELTKKFQTQEREFQEQMKVSLVSTYFVFAKGQLFSFIKLTCLIPDSQLEVKLLAALTFESREDGM